MLLQSIYEEVRIMAEKNNPWDDAGEPEKNGTWSSKAAAAEKIKLPKAAAAGISTCGLLLS